MTNVTDAVDRHGDLEGIVHRNGAVWILEEDYQELMSIAHAYLHEESNPPKASLSEAAADRIRSLLAEQMGVDPSQIQVLDIDGVKVDGAEDEEDQPSVSRGYDEVQLRLNALHLAAQLDMTKMQAAHGLENVPTLDTIGTAESFANFLTGGL